MASENKRPISMTLPPKIIDFLDEIAEDTMMSRSAAAVSIILEKMKEVEKAKGEEK